MFQEVGTLDAVWERRRSGGGEAQVAGLRAGNYSIRVAARNGAGLGPPADTYCSTLDDGKQRTILQHASLTLQHADAYIKGKWYFLRPDDIYCS